MIAGVMGSRRMVIVVAIAKGRVCCKGESRQGAVPVKLFGDIVRVIAYDNRR